MTDSTDAELGARWEVTRLPEGGLDVRVSQSGRGWITAVATALALAWIGSALGDLAGGRALPLQATLPMAVGIGLLLTAFALWCALGREGWHVAANCLEHRVGIGGWEHVRRYSDATLQIVERHDQYGKAYYRLYAVVAGQRHFLIERRALELVAWADFVARQTGWQRKDAAP
jgi:hypothetical protein